MSSTTNVLDTSTGFSPAATQSSTPLTTSPQTPSWTGSSANGLLGQYYSGRNFDNLKLSRTDGTVNFDWGTGSPDAALGVDNFSVRWSGKLLAKYSETYTFHATSDDGVRLWINGQQILNGWWDHSATEFQGNITLQAGQTYDLRMEYYENAGRAVSQLRWSSRSQAKEVIPQSQLFLPSSQVSRDTIAPTATANTSNLTAATTVPYRFTVTYSDDRGIDATTIDNNDIRVTTTNGFNQLARLVSVTAATNGIARLATYQIDAPGGTWDSTDNGTYTIALQSNQIKDTSGNTAAAKTLGSFQVNIAPSPIVANGNGLKAEYFDNIDFTNLKLNRTDASVNFDWGYGSPDASIQPDTFSARWTGQVLAKYSETYTFSTTSDDGVRLWVNGQKIIDRWVNQAATEVTGSITLQAGQKYDIRLEYYENGGRAVSKLAWSSRSQIKEIIPQGYLFSASFPGDTTAPTATASLSTLTTVGGSAYNFAVTYTDNVAINTSSLDGNDIQVTGPSGFNQLAQLVGVSTNGTSQIATYRIWAPGGSWDSSDNGTYTVALQANQVSDTSGNVAAARTLGSFQVSLTAPAPIDLNEAPVITLPGSLFTTPQSTSLAVTGIQIADDAGNAPITVTLTATNGILKVGDVSGGVTMANLRNNGTGSVVLIGTLMQINATLINPGGLTYTPNAGFLGSDRINVAVNDNGNTGSGGAKTDSKSFDVSIYQSTPPSNGTKKSPIGINLSQVVDYSPEWVFVDAFKASRPWISQKEGASWGQGGTLNLTKEGWIASLQPGQYATTIMFTGIPYPTGRYTLFYEGEGTIEFGLGSAKIISRESGKLIVDVPKGEGIFLEIRATNPNNPIRNIQFIMPGFENTYKTQPFHPIFLERITPFESLRFMDWQNTNNSKLTTWADRTTLQHATQADPEGVAAEYMIKLANTLKTDPWFTIPHLADDNYVRQFATLVRDTLDPSLKIYVEYSNEIWNYGFEQTRYAEQQGKAMGLSSDNFTAALRFYSQRSVEVFKIWEEVFGANSNRLEKVLASQAVISYAAEQVLSWKDAYKHADSYAIAPYFYGGDLTDSSKASQTVQMSVDQIVDRLLQSIRTDTKKAITDSHSVTQRFGIDLIAYEGGPHLTSYQMPANLEPQLTQLFNNANRSPRMRDVYREYLETWSQAGGGLFNQFNSVSSYNKYGQWGALEYQNQDINTAPKYLGILDFINSDS